MLLTWKHVLEQFEQLVKENSDYIPMLKIAEQIAVSDYADSIFPDLSHFALNLSKEKDSFKKLYFPSICVHYLGSKNFKITYSPKPNQTHNISHFFCRYEDV
jgi:hypothetical protein